MGKGLQSAARIICSPGANKFHTCRLRRIFAQVHAPGENGLHLICRLRAANSARLFGQSYKGPGISLAPCMIVEVPEIVRKLYDFRIFNWILCAFAGDVHGRGRGIRQGCIGGRSANVVENILFFV